MNSVRRQHYVTNKFRQFAREVTWGGLLRGAGLLVQQAAARPADQQADGLQYLDASMDWLARAQDARPDGGIAAYYSLYGGFGPSYLETTGYIIPTMIRYAQWRRRPVFLERAERATKWLLTLQDVSGGFPSGFATPQDDLAVFDTGQILFGLIAASRLNDPAAHEAALRAGRWLVDVQDPNGSWVRYGYEGRAHVYYTMVAWALAELADMTDDVTYRDAALANVQWAIASQQANGFFRQFGLGRRPVFLHFIAYTLQGLLEVGRRLHVDEAIQAVRKGSDAMSRQLQSHPTLAGAYDTQWHSTATYECLTGLAQMSLVFQGLVELGHPQYQSATETLNRRVRQTIDLNAAPQIRGAVKGSEPIWGRYLWMRYPNWAAKFFADAQLHELKAATVS